MGVYGLAWAAVIATFVEVVVLFRIMSIRIKGLFDTKFVQAVGRMLSATGFTAIITYIMVLLFPLNAEDQSFFVTFPKFALIVAVSLSSYMALCHLLKLSEMKPIVSRMVRVRKYVRKQLKR